MSQTREIIDGFKAAKEMMDFFKEANAKIMPLQEKFVDAVKGDNPQNLVEVIAAVGDLDLDDAQGGLIVVMGVLARIRVGLEGTECYDKVKDLFAPKGSERVE